jgi:hypothetical protein
MPASLHLLRSPAHPSSVVAVGLHNMLAWRNANMPGVPVWVTEWGWDAYRPGDTCGASTECVSQLAQAAYGVRGLSLMARKSVAQAHWFFYASESLRKPKWHCYCCCCTEPQRLLKDTSKPGCLHAWCWHGKTSSTALVSAVSLPST